MHEYPQLFWWKEPLLLSALGPSYSFFHLNGSSHLSRKSDSTSVTWIWLQIFVQILLFLKHQWQDTLLVIVPKIYLRILFFSTFYTFNYYLLIIILNTNYYLQLLYYFSILLGLFKTCVHQVSKIIRSFRKGCWVCYDNI